MPESLAAMLPRMQNWLQEPTKQ